MNRTTMPRQPKSKCYCSMLSDGGRCDFCSGLRDHPAMQEARHRRELRALRAESHQAMTDEP